MRSEHEMLDLIVNTAKEDERIRAAYLCGSRVNPSAPKDIFQDYDVGYVVPETGSFRNDRNWIDRFGNRLYMQYPEDNVYYPSDVDNCYGWLMQFSDGVRLDLHVCSLQHTLKELKADPLYMILLDKDHCLPEPPECAEAYYWVKKPTEKEFHCTCNEFWWCLNNVAKGLWREELPYVMDMLNLNVRPMLLRLLSWKIGIDTDFSVSVGKSGKHMHRWLSASMWERYIGTYPSAVIREVWAAAFVMGDIVDETAREVGIKLGFHYNSTEARGSRSYLEHVRHLPKDAASIL